MLNQKNEIMAKRTEQEFRELVRKMREAQRKYFAYRTSKELSEAKKYERYVDEELKNDPRPIDWEQLAIFKEERRNG